MRFIWLLPRRRWVWTHNKVTEDCPNSWWMFARSPEYCRMCLELHSQHQTQLDTEGPRLRYRLWDWVWEGVPGWQILGLQERNSGRSTTSIEDSIDKIVNYQLFSFKNKSIWTKINIKILFSQAKAKLKNQYCRLTKNAGCLKVQPTLRGPPPLSDKQLVPWDHPIARHPVFPEVPVRVPCFQGSWKVPVFSKVSGTSVFFPKSFPFWMVPFSKGQLLRALQIKQRLFEKIEQV